MKKIKKLTLFLLTGLFALVLTSCKKKDGKTIDFVYVNWAEGIDMVHVAKVVLERHGYNINLMSTDVAPLYSSLSKGNADVFLEAWLPVSDGEYMEEYGDKLDKLGVIYDSAMIGFVVPDYVTINSVSQLNEYKDKFDDRIIGIDAGAGSMEATRKAITAYGIELNLMPSSEAGMVSSLKKDIDKNKWIVITGWKPHWIFSRWDLKMLKDPKGAFGQQERIIAVSRKGFKEDFPLVAEFVENMHYTDAQMSSLMETFEEGNDNISSAKKWIAAHQELINSWIPDKMKESSKEEIE